MSAAAAQESKSLPHPGDVDWPALFAAIDRRDPAAFAAFLSPDAQFRFGNAPPVRGRTDIAAAVTEFFALLDSCRHRLTGSWRGETSAVCEGEVTYGIAGTTLTLPFVNVLELAGAGISGYRIYIDNGPLFAALGAARGSPTAGGAA